ncbi:helix-turn-helix domain-containing protein [Rhizomonospora bruguierae]|uniref:helix-turn-helix domain-containing protein n=1 Tax=Rhizomonospora bruguierae TaxID=1581705 RepID=UPI001BCAA542|nr:helix-turn-helix transcriptional regulator [Micromonospora sp. NBRC 107566]
MTERVDGAGSSSLRKRLDKLFTSVRKPDGTEYSTREVAEGVTEIGEPISHTYVGQLRRGEKDNPTLRHLRGLAKFFGVPVEYFTNDQVSAEVDHELDTLSALQALRVRTAAMRATVLPEAERSLAELARIVEVIHALDAAPAPTEPAAPSGEHGR